MPLTDSFVAYNSGPVTSETLATAFQTPAVQNIPSPILLQTAVAIVAILNVANVSTTGLYSGVVIQGYTLLAGDVVLLCGQTSQAENGTYTIQAGGATPAVRSTATFTQFPKWPVTSGTAAGTFTYYVGPIPYHMGTTVTSLASFEIAVS